MSDETSGTPAAKPEEPTADAETDASAATGETSGLGSVERPGGAPPPAAGGPPAPPIPTTLNRIGRGAVYLALLVFFANMVGAWWITYRSQKVIAAPLLTNDGKSVADVVLKAAPKANTNTHMLLNRMLDAELKIRAIQNQKSVVTIVLGLAFGLLAIGFALFVMGAEGAFQFSGKVADHGNLVVKSTAPGLFCFLVAGIIALLALTGRVELTAGTFDLVTGEAPNTASATAAQGAASEAKQPNKTDAAPPAKAGSGAFQPAGDLPQ